jgi:CrcB protein
MLLDPAIRAPIAISLGAIAGALSRYYVTIWFSQRFGMSFPYGTFFINLTGCLGMGVFITLATERLPWLAPEVRLLVATGFLGAYTTFSTYGLETLNLVRERQWGIAIGLYGLGSAVLGLVCVYLGVLLGRLGK